MPLITRFDKTKPLPKNLTWKKYIFT
jgi:hypothetical protein